MVAFDLIYAGVLMSSQPLTLQAMIAKILQFWSEQGCVIHQGYDLEVGAGTFNPATFLQALGPEPCKAAYVEPSRRPKDGRYGSHPNRLQKYFQLQVLLKPVPDNFLDLYRQSLQAIGLDLQQHDLRLVHDDWENLTIGAWGLGWEVWLDGMEISQLTYFQAIGSKPLDVVSGEITYGIERIAMYLQKKDSVFDILWNDHLTYGDIVRLSEQAWSQYNFDVADTKMWRAHFEDFAREAQTTAALNLPLPAYDFVIKASHAFNILDARGVISVTERTRYISQIRHLARLVADQYVEWRSQLHFPLLRETPPVPLEPVSCPLPTITSPEDVLIEIGSEELPATFVPLGIQQLEKAFKSLLSSHTLSYESLEVFGSPRRLSVLIRQLSPHVTQKAVEKKGPHMSSLFTEIGELTPHGERFFVAQGTTMTNIHDLAKHPQYSIKTLGTTDYLFITAPEVHIQAVEVLVQEFPKIVHHLKFPKTMTWSSSSAEYARPIRWLVALYGEHVLPITLGDVAASNISRGHQQLDHQELVITSPGEYRDILRKHSVIVSHIERKEMIQEALASFSGSASPLPLSRLLEESTFLSEHPFVACGHFDASFCSLPRELLIAEMVNHQKYFPMQDQDGMITNQFLMVCDNTPNTIVIHGNEKALAPRLTDGRFLFQQDLNTPLETFVAELKNVVHFEPLGSLFDKKERMKKHMVALLPAVATCSEDEALLAVEYCKADLVSAVVNEFPELQGIMGQYYVDHARISPSVAKAIGQHLQHITSEKETTTLGALLGLVDRFDNLLSCFILQLTPSSSQDPYALRRQSLEILTLCYAHQISIDLEQFLDIFADHFPKHIPDYPWEKEQIVKEIISFIYGRLRTFLINLQCSKDTLSAVLTDRVSTNPLSVIHDALAIEQMKHHHKTNLETIAVVHNRLKKILASLPQTTSSISPQDFFQAPGPEQTFVKAFSQFHTATPQSRTEHFLVLSELAKHIETFLDSVHVASGSQEEQQARIALLKASMEAFGEYLWSAIAL